MISNHTMKKLITLKVGMLLIVASGCSSTVTLGSKANENERLGASASTKGASVTVPFIKGEVKSTTATDKKKK